MARSSNTSGSDSLPVRPAAPIVESRGYRCCWGVFQCLTPRKKGRYQKPGTQLTSATQINVDKGNISLNSLDQAPTSSPLMHVPPSSPMACPFSENFPTVTSPAALLTLFPLNSASSAGQIGLRSVATGCISLENVLVTPPLHSTLTTAPTTPLSTAPFTPPPELAHLTTPPSPEIPFAELLTASLRINCSFSNQDSALKLSKDLASNLEQEHPPNNNSQVASWKCSNESTLGSTCHGPDSNIVVERAIHNSRSEDHLQISGNGIGMMQTHMIGTDCMNMIENQKTVKRTSLSPTTKPLIEVREEDVHGTKLSGICCTTCGDLASKCDTLTMALQQTQEKLVLVERKENLIDGREKKYKQVIQWMQLEAKSQQESIFRLSEALSWQEASFLDLQDKHLAEPGIDLRSANRRDFSPP